MKKIVITICLLLIFASAAFAAAPLPKATITWDGPKTYTDGSALDPSKDIGAYNVYFGLTSPPSTKIALPISASFPALATGLTYTVVGLTPGKQYYFAVTAVDQYGQEGAASNIIVKSMPLPPPPGPPTITNVIVAFIGMVLAFLAKLLFV